mmetsp:Transcript_52323/g.156133  ORF Transcript_52323/g.156133 Transcript_52323/m.156133 type:complete len:208 (+) Transcript_52323:386-1009(+)
MGGRKTWEAPPSSGSSARCCGSCRSSRQALKSLRRRSAGRPQRGGPPRAAWSSESPPPSGASQTSGQLRNRCPPWRWNLRCCRCRPGHPRRALRASSSSSSSCSSSSCSSGSSSSNSCSSRTISNRTTCSNSPTRCSSSSRCHSSSRHTRPSILRSPRPPWARRPRICCISSRRCKSRHNRCWGYPPCSSCPSLRTSHRHQCSRRQG